MEQPEDVDVLQQLVQQPDVVPSLVVGSGVLGTTSMQAVLPKERRKDCREPEKYRKEPTGKRNKLKTEGARAEGRPTSCKACGCTTAIRGAETNGGSGGVHRVPGKDGRSLSWARWKCAKEFGGCGIYFKMLRRTMSKKLREEGRPMPLDNMIPGVHDPDEQVPIGEPKAKKKKLALPQLHESPQSTAKYDNYHGFITNFNAPRESPRMFEPPGGLTHMNGVPAQCANPLNTFNDSDEEEGLQNDMRNVLGWFNNDDEADTLVSSAHPSPSFEKVAGTLMQLQDAGIRTTMLAHPHGVES